MVAMKKEQTYKMMLDIAKSIAKTGEGGLLVIGPKTAFKGKYKLLYPLVISGHSIDEKGMHTVLEKLANFDGAVVISDEGELLAYGAMIKKQKTVLGYGTKHAAAAGITYTATNSTAILISEKTGWVKVFQNSKIVMEMDSSDRPVSITNKIVAFLVDKDNALYSAAGVSAAIVGFAPVLIISGTYLAVKTATGIIKKNLKKIRL